MMRVSVIGAAGFVGSAFATYLAGRPGLRVVEVTRSNYSRAAGVWSDVVIDASCNSKKYLAEENPDEDFSLSVSHRLRTLRDFPAGLQVHISSVDVYGDLSSPQTTAEEPECNLEGASNYGFHKLLAEQLVRHYSSAWMILRLAGMVGPGLRKNPVYDVLHGKPLRIHPDSQYQFMTTGDVARIAWALVEKNVCGKIFNICGNGLISPREVASIAGRELNLDRLAKDARPRIVHVATSKISQIMAIPDTCECIAGFVTVPSRPTREVAETFG